MTGGDGTAATTTGRAQGGAAPDELLLSAAYAAYNAQDLDRLLAAVSDDVDWPAGPHSSRRLRGREAVRAHWTAQWEHSRTRDVPTRVTRRPDGRLSVRIEQVVHDRDGALLRRGSYEHLVRVQGSRITRLDIRPAP